MILNGILQINDGISTCSDNGAPSSILWVATFPAIMLPSVSRIILPMHKKTGIWKVWPTSLKHGANIEENEVQQIRNVPENSKSFSSGAEVNDISQGKELPVKWVLYVSFEIRSCLATKGLPTIDWIKWGNIISIWILGSVFNRKFKISKDDDYSWLAYCTSLLKVIRMK